MEKILRIGVVGPKDFPSKRYVFKCLDSLFDTNTIVVPSGTLLEFLLTNMFGVAQHVMHYAKRKGAHVRILFPKPNSSIPIEKRLYAVNEKLVELSDYVVLFKWKTRRAGKHPTQIDKVLSTTSVPTFTFDILPRHEFFRTVGRRYKYAK